MSSILKALQKLERDKETRKTREPDISSAIKMSDARKNEQARWLIPVVIASVAAVSILTTFSLMGGFSGTKQQSAPPVQQPSPQYPPPPIAPSPDQTAPSASADAVPSPSQFARPALPSSVGTLPRPAVPSLPAPQLSNEPAAQVEATPAPPPPAAVPQQPPPPLAESPVPRPKLEISGIAWQQDSSSRIAVVNGRSVSEGSSVDGARVEQIFPDKVRFSHSGKTFDMSLEHQGRP